MEVLHKLEKQMENIFKDLPKLSDTSKEALADFWPWLALIAGILQLLVAWGLYDLSHRFDVIRDQLNSTSLYLTGHSIGLSATDKALIYLGVIVLVVDAIILLMAYPKLRKRAKRGWDLIFLGMLINVVYAVLQLFTKERGPFNFFASLIGSFIGFYLLFQVREKFVGKSKPDSTGN